MSMSLGGGSKSPRRAEINVTPMIDVLLVLIIIFMVIQPSSSLGLNARIPQPPDEKASSTAPPTDVVITVEGNKRVRLNQEPLAIADLGIRLRTLFAGADSRVIFIRADKGLNFEEVAAVIDIVKGAGLNRTALMTQ
jgi:biopolymer transport protein TolR